MKKKTFATIFIVTQIIIVLAQIDKHSRFIKLCYEKQRLEKQLSELKIRHDAVLQEWCALTNLTEVQHFAQHELQMKPITFTAIQKLPYEPAT